MSAGGDFGNPLRKFKLVFLGEQSGEVLQPSDILVALLWIRSKSSEGQLLQ